MGKGINNDAENLFHRQHYRNFTKYVEWSRNLWLIAYSHMWSSQTSETYQSNAAHYSDEILQNKTFCKWHLYQGSTWQNLPDTQGCLQISRRRTQKVWVTDVAKFPFKILEIFCTLSLNKLDSPSNQTHMPSLHWDSDTSFQAFSQWLPNQGSRPPLGGARDHRGCTQFRLHWSYQIYSCRH